MKSLITAKLNPDLDGVACIYAYAQLLLAQGREVVGSIYGKPHPEAEYVLARFEITDLEREAPGPFASYILVDASYMKGLPTFITPDKVVEVIDHRFIAEPHKVFPHAQIQNEAVGAAATLIVEKCQRTGLKLTTNAVYLLYGAIFSNTLNFKADVTSARDRNAINWLEKQVNIPQNFIADMFHAKTKYITANLAEVMQNDAKEFEIAGKQVGVMQLEVVGLANLMKQKKAQMLDCLHAYKKSRKLNYIFLSAIDLIEDYNLFLTPDAQVEKILAQIFHITFTDGLARKHHVILRKEIIPKLPSLTRRV